MNECRASPICHRTLKEVAMQKFNKELAMSHTILRPTEYSSFLPRINKRTHIYQQARLPLTKVTLIILNRETAAN